MKYFLWLFFGVQFLYFLVPADSFAAVRINEIAWMGTVASQYSEWIELYNDGESSVSLDGWTLYKTGNILLFTLSKTISAGGYLLVERTTASAPDAVPGVNDESGTFGGGGLRNSGEDLILKDADGTAIDTLSYSTGWPAGDAKTKETMQWDGSTWITATGTPDAPNASAPVIVQTAATNQPVLSEAQTPSTAPSSDEVVVSMPIVSTPSTPGVIPVITTTPSTSIAPVVPITQIPISNNIVPIPATTVSKPQTQSIVQKKSITVKKKKKTSTTAKLTGIGIDTASNDAAADQLASNTDTPKENNHLKIIIFGVVVVIGTALFLLLDRLKSKVSQE